MKKQKSPGLELAIRTAGDQYALAQRLGITQSAVSHWKEVPSRHIIAIEKATGVSRRLLRPDLYDDETTLTGLVQPRGDETGLTGLVQPRRDDG